VTAGGRRTVIVWMAALGAAAVLVLAASVGPAGVVGDLTRDARVADTAPRPEAPAADSSPDRAAADPAGQDPAHDLGGWIQQLLGFGVLLAALWVSAAALRFVVVRLTRELPEQLVVDLEPLPDVEAGREALRRDRQRYETALGGSDVRNGIVACWVLLEETAAQVGVTRRSAETATEFVVRFLHTLDVDPRPVAALASLFHEARFSTHTLPADARTRAETALGGIQADLDRSAAW
jgi:hypothetical protein